MKHFVKKVENFTCDHCRAKVVGTGYTNHCPKCLWSKHVDLEVPGDRASTCHGLMKPTGVLVKADTKILTHQCLKCGKIMRNKVVLGDNFEEMLKLLSKYPQLQ